jgi:DDB1- and CUL4-associated factor 11
MRLDKSHQEEQVNSVCYQNGHNSNIILTAGDDCLIKIWDKRVATTGDKPSGAFVGHLEGVTHICSKGDDKYIASNGKDQLMKLWDMRKLVS